MGTARCRRCRRINRIPAVGVGSPRCGNCQQPLPWIAEASDSDFTQIAQRVSVPVIVDMWAPWCGPCRMVTPALEQIAGEYAGEIKLVKVNVDLAPVLSRRFSVQAIPTLLILDQGKVVAARSGATPVGALRAWVSDVLSQQETSAPERT